MKIIRPRNNRAISNLMKHLNFCHDGSMKKICFLKKRKVDSQNGSLIYPYDRIEDFTNCDISTELILNSYPKAKKNQIVVFEFKNCKSLCFAQDNKTDYSDIYEVIFSSNKKLLRFNFYATQRKVLVLSILCENIVCKQK